MELLLFYRKLNKRLKMVATLTVWEGDYGVASVDINCLILVVSNVDFVLFFVFYYWLIVVDLC